LPLTFSPLITVGGGGNAHFGGGGSGYIQSYAVKLVTDNDVGHGGAGYSGGGGFANGKAGCCDGGTNGGGGVDDKYNDGGKGTAEDISSYKLDNLVLTPGAGGKHFYYRHVNAMVAIMEEEVEVCWSMDRDPSGALVKEKDMAEGVVCISMVTKLAVMV